MFVQVRNHLIVLVPFREIGAFENRGIQALGEIMVFHFQHNPLGNVQAAEGRGPAGYHA